MANKAELIVTAGVYQIRNLVNGKKYIGSSVNIHERLTEHRRKLSVGKHENRHLQAAWNKYGAEAFVFETVLTCEPECVLVEEQNAIDPYLPRYEWTMLYNISPRAGAPMAGRKHTVEARKRIGLASVGNKYNLGRSPSAETQLKRRLTMLGKPHPHKGHPIDEATRAKISAKHRGVKRPQQTGKNNPMYGRICSAEVRARMSAGKTGVRWTQKRHEAYERRSRV